MNILYAIKQKGKIIFLLLGLGALELVNCHTYNRNITEMGNSVSEVYADRLMAQDYIYKLSGKIHERKWALQQSMGTEGDPAYIPEAYSLSILTLLRDYEKTKLTPDEKCVYEEFRTNMFNMMALQQRYAAAENKLAKQVILQSYGASLDLSLQQLEQLSGIQMQRGKYIHTNSQKIVSFSSLLTQLDWIVIFITLMIIMALIMATKAVFPKQLQDHLLN